MCFLVGAGYGRNVGLGDPLPEYTMVEERGQKRGAILLKSDRCGVTFGVGLFGGFCSDISFRLDAIRWC